MPNCLGVIWLVLCAANELESFKIYWDYLQLESCPFLAFIWGVFHIELYPTVRKDAGDEAYHHIVIITKTPDNTSILGAIFGDTTTFSRRRTDGELASSYVTLYYLVRASAVEYATPTPCGIDRSRAVDSPSIF